MKLSPFFETGPTRIPLHSSYYIMSIVVLVYSQTLLAAVKPKYMSTLIKRCISVPLLLLDLVLPVFFKDQNDTWNLLGATIPFMAFLRFFDLFWIAPAVQGKDAYASIDCLQIKFWTCLRKKEKDIYERDIKDKKKKKFYELLPHFLLHAIIADMIGAWFMTFTKQELMNMYYTRPVFYIIFFMMTLIAMNSGFTANGYILQLVYVLIYEGGSYCPEQWRELMENPICATSLHDIWSNRWHQSLKSTWLHLPFKEVRISVEHVLSKLVFLFRSKNDRKNATNTRRVSIMMAALSVFMCSGLLHEYIAYVNIGYTEYKLFAGQEMCFFTIQGIAVMIEKSIFTQRKAWQKSTLIRRMWTLGFLYITSPLFLQAFMHFNTWHAGSFFPPFQLYFLNILRRIPYIQYICGSLLFIKK